MAESSHTPDHQDHPDPALVLESLVDNGKRPPATWDEEGLQWVYEVGEEGKLVLTILDQEGSLVCQATRSRPGEWL